MVCMIVGGSVLEQNGYLVDGVSSPSPNNTTKGRVLAFPIGKNIVCSCTYGYPNYFWWAEIEGFVFCMSAVPYLDGKQCCSVEVYY